MNGAMTAKEKRARIVVAILLPLCVVLLDQLTKYLVRVFMQVGESVSVWGEFFRLTYVLNNGMAFGLGGNWRWVFMILTPVALTAIAVAVVKTFGKMRSPTLIALAMIFGGGLSNMIDRVFFYHLSPDSTGLFDGRVVDFLDFNITLFGKRVWNAVFNVADAFVVVGVFLLAVMLIVSERKARKKEEGKSTPDEHGGGIVVGITGETAGTVETVETAETVEAAETAGETAVETADGTAGETVDEAASEDAGETGGEAGGR